MIWSVQLYKKELEAEFGPFDDWVSTYELFRGKANEEEGTSDERFVGKFKVSFSYTRGVQSPSSRAEILQVLVISLF